MSAFEPLREESLAVRKNCGLFDHPNRGVLEVRGKDRTQFLHNVLTNDIKNLAPGTGTTACLLNAQAKIIASMNVLCFDDFFWLPLDYGLKDVLLRALKDLIVMDQVEVTDRSEELKLISVHGPKAKDLLEQALKQELPLEFLSHRQAKFETVGFTIVQINLTGEAGFGLLIPKKESQIIREAIEKKGASFSLKTIQTNTLEALRIEAAIPRFGIDFDQTNIPLEAGLEHTVSFSKGCFPGQEILARLDSRGGVAKKLSGLELKGEIPPKKNDRITQNGIEVGTVTSAVFSPTLKKTIAMAYLKKECWKNGTLLVVESGEQHIPARVESLPFYSSNPTS